MITVSLLLFVGMSLLAALSPGPNVFLVISLGVRLGFWPAFRAALGVLLANFAYAAISAAGLLALLVSSRVLFEVIKLAGACYLAWIGFQLLRSAIRQRTASSTSLPQTPIANPLLQGFLSQFANPRSLLYWGSLLPQFIPADSQNFTVLLATYGVSASVIDFSVLVGYAYIGNRARTALTRLGVQRLIGGLAGAFFLVAGLTLGVSTATGRK